MYLTNAFTERDMTMITIDLPEAVKIWLEKQVASGRYNNAGDYIFDLLRKEQNRHEEFQLTLEELNIMLEEGENSGISDKTIKQIFEDVKNNVKYNELI
jgi:antitoxin ParD1/3/4